MDPFGSPGQFLSSAFIGLVGTALFIYGKKRPDLRCLFMGVAMCVYPFFVTSVGAMWAVFGVCIGVLYAMVRNG